MPREPHQRGTRWSLIASLAFMAIVEALAGAYLGRWQFWASAVVFVAGAEAARRALPVDRSPGTAGEVPGSRRPGGRLPAGPAPARTVPLWGLAVVVLVVAGFGLAALGTR